MITRVLERLLSRPRRVNMSGTLLLHARLLAWQRRHATVAAEHVLDWLLRIADVRQVLGARKVHIDDAAEALERLMEDLPAATADEAPPFASEIDGAVARSMAGGVCHTGPLLENLTGVLPPAFTYLRAPLASVAPRLGELFDAELAQSKQGLTFEAWDPELRLAASVMQNRVDTRFDQLWWVTPSAFFVGILTHQPYFTAFKARGVDPKNLVTEWVASLPPAPAWRRARPASVIPSFAPHLYALLLRAERYAAEDASDVRLRHALAAIHDETELAPWVERLVR